MKVKNLGYIFVNEDGDQLVFMRNLDAGGWLFKIAGDEWWIPDDRDVKELAENLIKLCCDE